jgi:hypothetical protein
LGGVREILVPNLLFECPNRSLIACLRDSDALDFGLGIGVPVIVAIDGLVVVVIASTIGSHRRLTAGSIVDIIVAIVVF